VNYRINRMVKRNVITRFFAEVNTAKLGYIVFKVYLQFQNVDEVKEKEIFEYLMNHPNMGWIAVCSGRWDTIAAFWAKNVFEFNDILSEFLNKFSNYVLSKEIVMNLRYYIYNRKWLTKDKKPKISCIGDYPKEVKLNRNDLDILKFLTKNGRESIVNIANKLGLSSSLVIYRIKELVKKEVITAFRIDINKKMLNLEFCKSFIYLQNKTTEKENALIRFCSLHPNITALTQCIGPWDIELELETESFDQFHRIMRDIKNRFPDLLRSYESVLISKESGIRYIPK
jgi:Lrp/AsnC family leucine-responsive transcriptional regulator